MVSPKSNLTIAVLILPPVQLLDLSPVDLFHMLSKQYLTECKLPQPLIDQGLDRVTIHYVTDNGPSTSTTTSDSSSPTTVAELTASAAIRITHSVSSPEVQPSNIDILLVPGPDPSLKPSAAAKDFIRLHARSTSTTIMSVCTGIFPLAHAGILDGRTCTGPRALIGMSLRKEFPAARWVEKRWAVDLPGKEEKKGALWTAGGITNGQDMVAEYLRRNFRKELADLICALADVGGRGQEYGNGKAAEGLWWGWLLLRSAVKGLFGAKTK